MEGQAPEARAPAVQEIEREIARLHEAHAPLLLRYATAATGDSEAARDAVQESYFRYFLARQSGVEIANAKAWLYRVLRNYLLDQGRKRRGHVEIEVEAAGLAADQTSNPESTAARKQARRQMEGHLSRQERECVRMREDGFSYREIAETLNVQVGTVGAVLSRTIQKLKEFGERGKR
jgi:RNA polymerase sigma-70 factor (ECF subfamily)